MKVFRLICAIALTAVTSVAAADDGAITNKSMSRTIEPPAIDYGQNIVNDKVREDEHAFTDMMGFYVPAQLASGLVEPIAYCDIDNTPAPGEDCTNPVEELAVAKPLVNVFIHGPKFHVPETAFGHSFMDTYVAVSLNDGENWKQTNLSESADLSSFNLETDHNPSGPGSGDPLPGDHNIDLGGVSHANGFDTPYTAECTECHGQGLQGVAEIPTCYSCHGQVWSEPTPVEIGPVIYQADWDAQNKNKGDLSLAGVNAAPGAEVTILNAVTGEPVTTKVRGRDITMIVTANANGEFTLEQEFKFQSVPCVVMAEYTDSTGEVLVGPTLAVKDIVTGEPIENCEGIPVDLTEYPGGTYNVFHATAGNKTLAAWPSRFCSSGQPAYSMTTDNADEDQLARLTAITEFIRAGNTELGVPALPDFTSPIDGDAVDDLYLVDAFGVAGAQGSIDFADEGYPQAGVVPFGCVWTSRGVLLPGDDPRTDELESSHMVWTKAERLTSGRRDVNRIEVHAVKGAGFVITWQEDPEGLRPGQGLGPGEGWSGAVAHSQTDAWYSFINEEYFDIVETVDNTTVPIDILDHDLTLSGRPQLFVPMAIPMRLSNNAKCNAPDQPTAGGGTEDLYCIFEATDEVPVGASAFGLKDQCADTVTIITGPAENPDQQTETEICVADIDGDETADLPNRANTGLTRPRTSLQGYDTDGDGVTESAWVVVAAEESKGLGKFFFEPSTDGLNAIPCEEDSSETCTEEIGKNQWYFSFDMGTPDTSADADNPNSLVWNLVNQGNMLNQGEVYWETGELFGLMSTEDMEDYGDYNFEILNTEIARRASLLVQSVAKATASSNGLAAMPVWKQGTMRQGGPADTMLRRMVLPDTFDAAVDNPYAFANMVCEEFLIEPDTNPYYPGGVCADPATNLSGVVPDTCVDDGEGGASIPCPTVDFGVGTYGAGDTNPILQGVVQGEGNTMRVLTWHQCPSDGTLLASDGITPVDCDSDDRDDEFVNLLDQSWYNPLDVSKGHRGFLDGDFVQFLHAWSPNWRLNAKGNDRYDLYVRRSFDGGNTWTTTPSSFTASDDLSYSGDGTVTCERYRPETTTPGDRVEPTACYEFDAGVNEHARNVTQHKALRITTLDPRYAATKATIEDGCTDGLFVDDSVITDIFTCDDLSVDLDSDLRNPSRYFMVYETGDNTTVEVGEAEPLDLFYGRAESFGDDYVVWTETDTDSANPEDCYPTVDYGVEDLGVAVGSGFCNEFDNMNTGGDTHASEANLESNPDGSKLYGTWAQWVFDEAGEEVVESDAMARRIWWIDDYVSDNPDLIYTLPGTQQPE